MSIVQHTMTPTHTYTDIITVYLRFWRVYSLGTSWKNMFGSCTLLSLPCKHTYTNLNTYCGSYHFKNWICWNQDKLQSDDSMNKWKIMNDSKIISMLCSHEVLHWFKFYCSFSIPQRILFLFFLLAPVLLFSSLSPPHALPFRWHTDALSISMFMIPDILSLINWGGNWILWNKCLTASSMIYTLIIIGHKVEKVAIQRGTFPLKGENTWQCE